MPPRNVEDLFENSWNAPHGLRSGPLIATRSLFPASSQPGVPLQETRRSSPPGRAKRCGGSYEVSPLTALTTVESRLDPTGEERAGRRGL